MTEKRFTDVWDAVSDTPEMAANMKLRTALMTIVTERIKTEGLSQGQAAERLHVTQPRISDLMRGKIDLFALDTLVAMVDNLDLALDLKVREKSREAA